MHRDEKELLIGYGVILLFGVALIVWPSFAEFVGHFVYSPLQHLVDYFLGIIF
jgi:hypothetical protein